LTPTRFWALVHRLVERGDVVAEMPVEVGRLRRVREARAGRGAPDGAVSEPISTLVTR